MNRLDYFDPSLPYPIPPKETWNIIDSTKYNCFISCPRRLFFEYILGWRRASNHLTFGHAWHEGMEEIVKAKDPRAKEVIQRAYLRFLSDYRKTYSEEEDEHYWPKTPTKALYSYITYADKYHPDYNMNVKIVNSKPMTEIAGSVYLTDEHLIHFRMDAICDTDRGITALEHKTGTSTYMWADQWELHMQILTYYYALFCLYPLGSVSGVTVNGVFFKKIKYDEFKEKREGISRYFDFMRVPIYRQPHQLEAWLWNTVHFLDQIKYNYDLLSQCSKDDKILKAFPMNFKACSDWGGCDYKNFCLSWDNPLKYTDKVPLGFEESHWNPMEVSSNHVMEGMKS